MTDLPPGGPLPAEELVLPIDVGRRVVVLANLLLTPEATPASTWATTNLARMLDAWPGPGTVVVAGNLLDLTPPPPTAAGEDGTLTDKAAGKMAEDALQAHHRLREAFATFAAGEDRRVLILPGPADALLGNCKPVRAAAAALGATVVPAVDLRLSTATGTRRVRIQADDAGDPVPPSTLPVATDPSAAWQEGIDRLSEPASLRRFLASRLLYRRFARFGWWLLIPFAAVVLLRMPFTTSWLDHLLSNHPLPDRAISRARQATWGSRLLVAGAISLAVTAVLAVILAAVTRKAWAALGGGKLAGVFEDPLTGAGATANDRARDDARVLVADDYDGVVTGATLSAELTDLGTGFFACAGTAGEVVEEHPGRLGLPPVFLHHRQVAWVELETGAELHARLLLARADTAPPNILERLAARYRLVHDTHPVVVASHPHGASWPPAPDLALLRRRSRRYRRWASAAIAVAGGLDLLSAVTPPLRSRLHMVLQVVPLGAAQLAGALVALAGISLLALARGVRRGQHRAWVISVALLTASLVLHLVHRGAIALTILSAGVLAFLLVNRGEFRAASDRPSLRSAFVTLVAGVVAVTAAVTVLVEITLHFRHDRFHDLSVWQAGQAVAERMIGIENVTLPDTMNDFLSPSLLAIGITLAGLAVILATRPVVDRRLNAGRPAQARARDIVLRHGSGTLDYFALRSDKHWFFHRDSLVAYAMYSGICLVSPDPVGPRSERDAVWAAFRRFADAQGWVVAVMGASADCLPLYRATGMHDIYIGDEAVVDPQRFSLGGGHMKGLRQAFNRIAKYGYTATFHDPANLDRAVIEQLAGLMGQSRRGEFERGFSMMLGRIFDPRDVGIILCIVHDPQGKPAAMCQFVPAPGIGGYSLDLMRRDRGEHPNGLIDFALVSTIEHLRALGMRGLSLNFAAMREVLEGERGAGIERWALKKMSSFMQIESLWKFNAKYEPDWLPRYVLYDTAEHLVPVTLAILRAESMWEVPVIGRVIAASDRRAHEAADSGDAGDSGASLLPDLGDLPDPGDLLDPDPDPGASGSEPTPTTPEVSGR